MSFSRLVTGIRRYKFRSVLVILILCIIFAIAYFFLSFNYYIRGGTFLWLCSTIVQAIAALMGLSIIGFIYAADSLNRLIEDTKNKIASFVPRTDLRSDLKAAVYVTEDADIIPRLLNILETDADEFKIIEKEVIRRLTLRNLSKINEAETALENVIELWGSLSSVCFISFKSYSSSLGIPKAVYLKVLSELKAARNLLTIFTTSVRSFFSAIKEKLAHLLIYQRRQLLTVYISEALDLCEVLVREIERSRFFFEEAEFDNIASNARELRAEIRRSKDAFHKLDGVLFPYLIEFKRLCSLIDDLRIFKSRKSTALTDLKFGLGMAASGMVSSAVLLSLVGDSNLNYFAHSVFVVVVFAFALISLFYILLAFLRYE